MICFCGGCVRARRLALISLALQAGIVIATAVIVAEGVMATIDLNQVAQWHWFPLSLAAITLWVVINAVTSLIVRLFRVIMVALRGWPTHPFMDADGDIHGPIKVEQEGEQDVGRN